jgi:hypothetical protein
MPEPSDLSSMARSKLQSSFANKDSSLHRWVLLKNSLLRSQSSASPVDKTGIHCIDSSTGDEELEDEEEYEESDSFLFPDAGKLLDDSEEDVSTSEAQWLDSLLETLVDADEDQLNVDNSDSALPVDEEDLPLSPLISPMSSSDDLINQPVYFPPPIAVPYPIPYPPVLHSYTVIDSSLESPPGSSLPSLYANSTSTYEIDDVEELSVPEAIEDTSDDESDAPPTPSLRNSTTSTISLNEPTSTAVPASRRRGIQPQVYIGSDSSYFYPFELDPLPFAENDFINPEIYPEC